MPKWKKWIKRLGIAIGLLSLLLILGFIIFLQMIKIEPPKVADHSALKLERTEPSPGFYKIGNSWFRKNRFGLYEMYVEGKPFDRGVINGKLSKELVQKQEDYFVTSIKELIPNEFYLRFLRYFVGFFDRKLPDYIPEEYQQEIYGVSQSASEDYTFIGGKYDRLLNYHAAHDIGHALQGMNMVVGCSSFSAWGNHTADGQLLVGRNFDFFVGEDFAKNKIVEFVHPANGHDFMMITWGGMIGCVSGMNDQGMTLTINAAKSDYPSAACTPISIVSREILQYAGNIDEAYKIAAKRKTFVSETIMIGSAKDGKTALIEKSPTRMELIQPKQDYIICANHYQGKTFSTDENNQQNIKLSNSVYRYALMENRLAAHPKLGVDDCASILRDRKGLKGEELGNGNDMALNQLICHHSVIFKPGELKAWVSAGPYQEGAYVCYDLKKIFAQYKNLATDHEIDDSLLTIAADSFMYSKAFEAFQVFRHKKHELQIAFTKGDPSIFDHEEKVKQFIALDPEYYDVYGLVGRYYQHFDQPQKALKYYRLALSKRVASEAERIGFEKKIKELEAKK